MKEAFHGWGMDLQLNKQYLQSDGMQVIASITGYLDSLVGYDIEIEVRKANVKKLVSKPAANDCRVLQKQTLNRCPVS